MMQMNHAFANNFLQNQDLSMLQAVVSLNVMKIVIDMAGFSVATNNPVYYSKSYYLN